jgi:lipopolysaccharide/colanic/teichoic acid biosynthesis glycosyltransferase
MRFLYICFIVLLICISIPLYGLLALLVILDSGFPVFYRQRRHGQGNKTFLMIKFRTMRKGAEALQHTLSHLNEADGPVFKIRDDPRYTRAGRFLAHTGLDELPQLWNVLSGDMALFGPRPLPVAEAGKLKPWQKERHTIQPGIISPAVLTGRYHEDFDRWMKSDIEYVKNKNIGYDFQMAMRSVLFLASLWRRR